MKRFILFTAVLLIFGAAVGVAEQATLINFTQLVADYPADDPVNHASTVVDYSSVAGSSFTDEQKREMRTSLAIQNWEVTLNSSASNVVNLARSQVRPAPVREGERVSRYPGEVVLGVRVHFPTESNAAWALIEPPFEIPAYSDPKVIADDGTISIPDGEQGTGTQFDNFGVVKNVGVLRRLSAWVHGLNYPHGLSIILQDESGDNQEIFMGYLDFNGWRELVWENPNYISEVRDRELRPRPLYPQLAPMRKLIGIRVYRDASLIGGDFVTYIGEINVTYDEAVLELERDINDEAVWGILQAREQDRAEAELNRLGNIQVLRYLERQKMDTTLDEANGQQ